MVTWYDIALFISLEKLDHLTSKIKYTILK